MAYLHKDKESCGYVKSIGMELFLKTYKMKNETVAQYYIKSEKLRSKGKTKELTKGVKPEKGLSSVAKVTVGKAVKKCLNTKGEEITYGINSGTGI